MTHLAKRKGYPEPREVVMVTVKQITPYSALCSLNEYPGKEGMIHVSEVTGKWVRDIKKFVKNNKQYAARVLRVDEKKGHINLSLKRLSKKERERKFQDFKQEERAEKMLGSIAKMLKISLDETYEKIGFELQESFGTMFKAFELGFESPDPLIRRDIPKDYAVLIHKVAKENIQKKRVKIKAELNLKFYTGDGIERVKEFLNSLTDKYKFDVKYISAPRYSVEIITDNPKLAEKKLREELTEAVSNIKDGEVSFKIGEKT